MSCPVTLLPTQGPPVTIAKPCSIRHRKSAISGVAGLVGATSGVVQISLHESTVEVERLQ